MINRTILISIIITAICCFTIGCSIFFSSTPTGRGMWNSWFHKVQEVDDVTNYETLKEVENTCRAMIASYESDKLIYDQYKNSDDFEKQSWAEQAKMRANKTASTYNNYIIKNNYIWRKNIPDDIYEFLEYIY